MCTAPEDVLENGNKIEILKDKCQNLNVEKSHSTYGLKFIEEIFKKHMKHLKEKYFVKIIGIFGSYSRGEVTPESDVDVLVEFSVSMGLEFIGLKNFLESILSRKVDLVTEKGIRPQMKKKIFSEVVYV